MSLITRIKSDPKLKRFILFLLIPANEYRPRFWVRLFLNRFKHKRGKYSIIRRRTRIDVFPFNEFNLGARSVIEDFSTINNGVGNVNIGEKTFIGMGNVIIGPVTIGNNVILAQNIVISGLNHGYKDINIPPSIQKIECKPIYISDDVWVGANCVITAGVTVGKHSVIGAGSVVTKDIPDFSVAVGNPATVVKKYSQDSKTWVKTTK